jgi:hypothetical protein
MFEIGLVMFECSRQNHNAYGLLFVEPSLLITARRALSLVPKQKWRGVVKADFEFVQGSGIKDLWTFGRP